MKSAPPVKPGEELALEADADLRRARILEVLIDHERLRAEVRVQRQSPSASATCVS